VRAHNALGDGPWSPTFSFSTKRQPGAPSPKSPSDGSTDESTTTTVTWAEAEEITSYSLEVSTTESFTENVVSHAGLTATSRMLADLRVGTTYFWRVRAHRDHETSDWSSTFRFTTAVSTSAREESLPGQFELGTNYPNPFRTQTTIPFQLPEVATVTVKAYNTLGEEIETVVSQTFPAGRHEVEWNSTNVPAGTYLVRIQAGQHIRSLIMTRLR
jgi:hypothetical protein